MKLKIELKDKCSLCSKQKCEKILISNQEQYQIFQCDKSSLNKLPFDIKRLFAL